MFAYLDLMSVQYTEYFEVTVARNKPAVTSTARFAQMLISTFYFVIVIFS